MTQFLNAGTRKLIESRMKRGGYATPDDVVVAALASLEQNERFGDFASGELDKLLAEGEGGGFVDGAKALEARRRRRARNRSGPGAKSA
jgi:hypothetical protein